VREKVLHKYPEDLKHETVTMSASGESVSIIVAKKGRAAEI